MLLGFEAPNIPSPGQQFWDDFERSKSEILKVRLYHGLEVYQHALRINPTCRFLLRPTDEGRLNVVEQLEKAKPRINELHANGIDPMYLTWSEPDHVDGRYGGPQDRLGAFEFYQVLDAFLWQLQVNFPGLETVSPPLVVTAEQSVFDEVCGSIFARHSYIGHHSYWQDGAHRDPMWGFRIFNRMKLYGAKSFIVSEVGDSSNDGKARGEWTPATVQYGRILDWYNEVRRYSRIEAACIFIGRGSTPEWMGWWPSNEAIEMIRNRGGEKVTTEILPTEMIGNLEVIDLRAELADQAGKMLPVPFTEKEFISIHHTVTPTTTTAKAIYDYHISKGWGGIGYNFLVFIDGRIEYVGECNTARAAIGQIATGNRRGVHIAMVIDLTQEQPSEAMLAAVKRLAANIQHAYGFFMPTVPHCLFNSQSQWDTSCPVGWRTWWKEIIRAVGE